MATIADNEGTQYTVYTSALTKDQREAAIQKAHDISSSASEIDGKYFINKNTISIAGDSIASQNGGADYDTTDDTYAVGSLSWFNFFSNQKLQFISNHGVGGERTDQLINRLDAVFADNPKYVLYIIGKNDVVQLVSAQTIISNLIIIINKTIESGIIPIMTTIIPREVFSQSETDILEEVNNWIMQIPTNYNNVLVSDFYDAIAKKSDGTTIANSIRDGIHPSVQGARLLGEKLDNDISKFLPNIYYFSGYNAKTNNNLLTNPFLINGTSPSISDWTVTGAIDSHTVINRDDGLVWRELDINSTGSTYLFQTVTSGFSDGDKVEFILEYEIDDSTTNIDKFQIYMQLKQDSTILKACSYMQLASSETIRFPLVHKSNGVLKTKRVTVPIGANKIICFVEFKADGKIRLGRASLRKIN